MNPLLSIVTITYNQEKYIRNCIEGVLRQKVDFPIEYIIADDCSSDHTRKICEEYAIQHPATISLLTRKTNIGPILNEQEAFKAASGKYIATCEGDDYWTDPFKLQKQVDFLENHPEYSVCFHRYNIHDLTNGFWANDYCGDILSHSSESSIEISMNQFMSQWVTQYLTMVFRKDCYDFHAYTRYTYYRDTHQIYHLMMNGKCRLFSFVGGVYQLTGSGEYTTKSDYEKEVISLAVNTELWKINKDDRWQEICAKEEQNILYRFSNIISRKQIIQYSLNIYRYNHKLTKLIKNLLR